VEGGEGREVALGGVDPVGGDQQQPVRGAGLAEPLVGVPADHAGQAFERYGRAEDRCQACVLDRALAGLVLLLLLGQVPVRAGLQPAYLARVGRAVGGVEVCAPARDAGSELLRRLGQRRLVGGVRQALRAATSTPARRFGLADRGRILEGLRADLLLVDGDPTWHISDTLDLRQVWRRGTAALDTRSRR
jgi:hypothetical protein